MYNHDKAIAIAAQFCAAKYGVDAHRLVRQASEHTRDEYDFIFDVDDQQIIVRAEGPYYDEMPNIYEDYELVYLFANIGDTHNERVISIIVPRMIAGDMYFIRNQTMTLEVEHE